MHQSGKGKGHRQSNDNERLLHICHDACIAHFREGPCQLVKAGQNGVDEAEKSCRNPHSLRRWTPFMHRIRPFVFFFQEVSAGDEEALCCITSAELCRIQQISKPCEISTLFLLQPHSLPFVRENGTIGGDAVLECRQRWILGVGWLVGWLSVVDEYGPQLRTSNASALGDRTAI